MTFKLRILSSAAELAAHAESWDRLWEASHCKLATARAVPLLAWLESFARRRRFRALTIVRQDRLVAALPIIDLTPIGRLGIGGLPNNYFSAGGDLLVDPEEDINALAREIVAGLRLMPWAILRLAQIEASRPDWQTLMGAISSSGLPLETNEMYRVGRVRFEDDAAQYHQARSRKHRANMRRSLRMAEEFGGAKLEIHRELPVESVEPLLREAFSLEHSGWKGSSGTSVLSRPELWAHYLKEARILAASGHLALVFLVVGGQRVAFEYSFIAKGQYTTPKVGYPDEMARLSPGQLLCQLLYASMADQPHSPVVDLMGPLNEAERKWTTEDYALESALVTVRSLRGRTLAAGLNGFMVLRRAMRRAKNVSKSA